MIGTQLIEVDERAPSLRWMLRATIRSARTSGVLRLSITGKHAVDKSAQIPPADVDVLARNRCTNTGQHNPFHPGSLGARVAVVASAVSRWIGYRRAGGHRLFTANDREPTEIGRFL